MKLSLLQDKKTTLFLILGGIFFTNAMIGETLGMKIVSLDILLGLSKETTGNRLNFTTGVLIWPIVFVTTDIVNEYFGKRGVRLLTFFSLILMVYTFVLLAIFVRMPPAPFWIDLHAREAAIKPFNINYAFAHIFQQAPGIIIGSLTAFVVGQLLDSHIFHAIRRVTGAKYIWLRATGSTIISQMIDSVLVLLIAFYFLGSPAWTLEQVFSTAAITYAYKLLVAIALTPVLYLTHYWIDSYLGITPHQITEEAMQEV
ncbi:MAG: queuosine precursor transporter [Microscillaceae bacterium]|nr:queuosine precursor transporter [Microscillaceae bacterium]MDW8461537.1 queuosine precursor transporter [Cytophagales bacterium]